MNGHMKLVFHSVSLSEMDIGIRLMWLLVGLSSLVFGVLGVFLPLLPTTPFLLVSVFAFARSSERLHGWMIEHPTFGPLIENWHKHGSIDRRTKRIAIIVIMVTPIITWRIGAPGWALACQVVVLMGAAAFILTRPDPPVSKSAAV